MLEEDRPVPIPRLVARGGVGGVMMGLANLVPGISGGTMLLAAGVYPQFISAIADVVTLKLRLRSFALLASVVTAAGLAILLLAGPVKDLVVHHRWAMYSLFIGLTLGGVPIVRDLLGRVTGAARLGIGLGFAGMVALAWFQAAGDAGGAARGGFAWMLFAGLAGASAMILPGVSGGYLLLVLGAYVPILSGIDAFKDALAARDVALAVEPLLEVVLPVGIGVVVGIVAVSNALKWLLVRYRELTLGILLGLLVGAVAGLYPFQEGVRPTPGDQLKGRVLTEELIAELPEEDWPTRTFAPSAGQVGGAVALGLLGFAVTGALRRFGSSSDEEPGRQE